MTFQDRRVDGIGSREVTPPPRHQTNAARGYCHSPDLAGLVYFAALERGVSRNRFCGDPAVRFASDSVRRALRRRRSDEA